MSDESALLQAVRSNLHDDLPRLVYADWLEERGDLRHRFLRLECELVRTWGYAKPRHDLHTRLAALRAQFDPAWLAQVRRCTTPAPPVDVAEVFPDLKPMARTTVRLHPRPGEAAIDASKIGGRFVWPAKEEWPRCAEHDCPFVCALQLRKEDVPEAGFKPGTYLFQLLWCPHDHEPGFCPDVRAYWWERGSIRTPAEVPEPPTPRDGEFLHLPTPCLLYPERVTEYPDVFEFEQGVERYLVQSATLESALAAARGRRGEWRLPDDGETMYHAWLSAADGWKVGGWPDWVQDQAYPVCECGTAMTLLVQCGSTEFDGITWGRWLCIQEREVLTSDYGSRRSIQDPVEVMFGDAGNLYVFHCTTCQSRPIRVFMQCS